ncbi:uncharacterized protein At1g08160 [Ziziphus jujuba]|uniref:Uncharacterized protein At1g08160 n=1 Tax=Ziziphus jujuba TaxID=326968 RepID=A0A6P3Z835_ZIZJJ|nr:uncharacterized protein At1g08160 [Ziziphus jujuba]
MASSSGSTSKSDDRQHYRDREAAQEKQSGESSSSSSSKQIKYIPFVVVGIIVVMSAAMGMIWAVVKPKRPVYAMEYAHIENVTLFPNPMPTSLIGNFSFVMRAYNPNKNSTIFYESMKIFNTTDSGNESATPFRLVKNFCQPAFNVTRIPFKVPVQTSSGPDDNMLGYLQHGRITMNISVEAKMIFKYRLWTFMPRTIKIYCQPAAVFLGNNSQPSDCYINF